MNDLTPIRSALRSSLEPMRFCPWGGCPYSARSAAGVVSHFVFTGTDQAKPAWCYPDLGPHVVYLSNVIGRTLAEQMREESLYLRSHAQPRAALKEIVEMPDPQADRLLRSIEQTRGKLSNVLAKEMPVLQEPGVWTAIVEAVSHASGDGAAADGSVIERYRPGRPAGN